MNENRRRMALIAAALACFDRGNPLPVDLTAQLLEFGIDVAELERKYCTN